jgi:hypothetical protein
MSSRQAGTWLIWLSGMALAHGSSMQQATHCIASEKTREFVFYSHRANDYQGDRLGQEQL